MSADLKVLLNTLDVLDNKYRVRKYPVEVTTRPNPADKCADCGAQAWHTDHRNGHEIGLCDDCK